MGNRFASGKYSIAECDRCGARYKLKQLKQEVIKTKLYQIKVCEQCWDPDQPQLQLGMYPVDDPQAVYQPRPDITYVSAGLGTDGTPTGGSRDIQWGWNPVGGARFFDAELTPNNLVLVGSVGTVTVLVT
jgi:NAD-dependent SIR2 family protein deacetylase